MSKEARRPLGDMLRELNLTGVAARGFLTVCASSVAIKSNPRSNPASGVSQGKTSWHIL